MAHSKDYYRLQHQNRRNQRERDALEAEVYEMRSSAQAQERQLQAEAREARAAQDRARRQENWHAVGYAVGSYLQQRRNDKIDERLAEQERQFQEELALQQANHQFANWSQTPYGRHFVDWRDRSHAAFQVVSDRETRWSEAWTNEQDQTLSSIPQKELKAFDKHSSVYDPSGAWKIVTIIFAVLAVYLWWRYYRLLKLTMIYVNDPLAIHEEGWEAETLTLLAVQLVVPLFVLIALIWLLTRKLRRERKWKKIAPGTRRGSERVQQFGFDPLSFPYGGYPFSWSTLADPVSEAERNLTFAEENAFNFPPPNMLPPVVLPEPIKPAARTRTFPSEVLREFRREQEQLAPQIND